MWDFVNEHLATILFFVFLVAGWLGYGGKLGDLLAEAKEWYVWVKAEARSKKIWKFANTAYNQIDNAHALARKTDTKVDDELVNKAEAGLKLVIKAMKAMGLDPTSDEKDIILGHFDAIHEAERKAKEARGVLPLAAPADEANS